MNFKYITTMRETLMTTTDKNNFKIKIERIRDRNIFHANKAQDLFTYGVNRPKITSIPDSDKKIIEGRMWGYFTQPTLPNPVYYELSYNQKSEDNNNYAIGKQVELLTAAYDDNPTDNPSYQQYTIAIRNIANENIARYTDAQNSLAINLKYEGEDQSTDVQDSIFAAYEITSAILLSAIVDVTQFLASLIMNIGLWLEDVYTTINEFFTDINTNISEGFVWALKS